MYNPNYPIYVISKGRHDCCLTANFFIKDNVKFHIVIEPQELDLYKKYYSEDLLYVLPFSNLGKGSYPARNWCWEHSKKLGYKRHWIFDDNIRKISRANKDKRIKCNTNIALKIIEDFTERYESIAISGLNYEMFVVNNKYPFIINCHVYSALLIYNNIPYRWRLRYNEDTDLCLQVITNGLYTILFNSFCIKKVETMKMKGGNMETLYKGNGRLKMARTLQEVWPEYVETKWRYNRPQHVIKNSWRDFKKPLIKRKDIDWDKIKETKYNMKLRKTREIKSEELKLFYESYNEKA